MSSEEMKAKVEELRIFCAQKAEIELKVHVLEAELVATQSKTRESKIRKLEAVADSVDVNLSNYADVGKGTQAQALASSHRQDAEWIIDSGASRHVTGMSNLFETYTPYTHSETVQIADGTSQHIHGVGSLECTPSLCLSSVLHVPSFPVNLLSVSSMVDQFKCIVIFDENCCTLKEKSTGRVIGTGVRRNGLWFVNHGKSALTATFGEHEREVSLLHRRLGHVPFESLNRLYPDAFQGSLHYALTNAIRPHVELLRTSPYCKRTYSRALLKK